MPRASSTAPWRMRRSSAASCRRSRKLAPRRRPRRAKYMVDLGLKTLLHDKVRFLITVSGVAFAVTLVLVQVGLFVGLLDNSTITIRKLDADLWVTSRNSPNLDFVHQFPEANLQRARTVPGVARADNLILSFMQVALP